MALLLFATPALLVPPFRVPRRAERQPNVRMELRMPEDGSTVDALIERTKQTTAIVVLYYTDAGAYAGEPKWDEDWGDGVVSSARDDLVSGIASTYSASAQAGGRPLMVLRIERAVPEMNVICSQRGVVDFPLLQIWSRGQPEAVDAGALERRLLALGVKAPGGAAEKRAASEWRAVSGGFGAGPRAARRGADNSDAVDFFGVGSGGGQLTREGVANAKLQETKKFRMPSPDDGGGDDGDGELPPVEAMGLDDALSEEDAARESKMDALFAEPNFDIDLE